MQAPYPFLISNQAVGSFTGRRVSFCSARAQPPLLRDDACSLQADTHVPRAGAQKVQASGGKAGGAFSKATFSSDGAAPDVELDDPRCPPKRHAVNADASLCECRRAPRPLWPLQCESKHSLYSIGSSHECAASPMLIRSGDFIESYTYVHFHRAH